MTYLLILPVEFVAVTNYGTGLRVKCLKLDAGYDPHALARLLVGKRITGKLTARSHGEPGQVSLPDADNDLVMQIDDECQKLMTVNKRLFVTLKIVNNVRVWLKLTGKRGLIEVVEILPAEGTR